MRYTQAVTDGKRRDAQRILPTALALIVCLLLGPIVPQTTEAAPLRQDDPCADPANPVVAENCLPGSDAWLVQNYLSDIVGYAYPPTVNIGERVGFFVDSQGSAVDLDVFRSGYYQGLGGRLIMTLDDVPAGQQPACQHDLTTGLTSCGNWQETAQLDIPEDWVSGVYVVKVTRQDTGGENYLLFVVRDDARPSDVLYQQSLFTYHAYNNFGGKSIYDFNSGHCLTDTNNVRASRVSLQRPFTGDMSIGANYRNNYFRVEYPMVRWLEQQGYDVTYSTTLDTHHSGQPDRPNRLLDHTVFLSVGHDEYWTQTMRDAVTEARDAGVNLGIFSANTMYWRVRIEDDPWSGEPDSVIVTYKTTEDGPPDPSGHPTGTWRDPDSVDDPENGLWGVQYIGDNDDMYFPLRVTAEQGADRIYRHTDLQDMPPGTYANLGQQVIGWEWDAVVDNGLTPDGVEILAASPTFGLLLQDAGNSDYADARLAESHTTRYTAASGATVFAAGTIQWSWGLGARSTTIIPPDPYLPQVTYNVLADLGAQPATPAESLVLDGEEGTVSAGPDAFLPVEPPEPPAITDITLDLSGELLTAGRTVAFSWQTNVETLGQVWIGRSAETVNEPAGDHDDFSREHTIRVTGLGMRPNFTYYYRLVAIDRAGNITASQVGSFVTPVNPVVSGGMLLRDGVRAVTCWAERNPLGAGTVLLAAVVIVSGGMIYIGRRVRQARAAHP